jgi:hypothetical protein
LLRPETPITFQRGLNPALVPADAAHSCEAPGYGQKNRFAPEQKGFVAASPQLGTIDAPALPRSNQIEATLFD